MTNLQTRRRTFLLLAALYLSQGLPFGFFSQALPVLLRERGTSLEDIGFASLLALPWALKFLWAPVVDRRWSRGLGRRRSWLIPLQAATVAVLVGTATFPLDGPLLPLLLVVLVLNTLAATQDIATDGLAIDVLPSHDRGIGNGIQVAGYRVGMVVGGGAMLWVLARFGFSTAMIAMAIVLAIASIPILRHREQTTVCPPKTRESSLLADRGAMGLLALLVIYKAGDGFATAMLRPLLVDRGFDLAQLGFILGVVGFLAGLLGALVGGASIQRLGRTRALVGFAALQACGIAAYGVLASFDLDLPTTAAICGFEHFAGGTATAALFTCMMDRARPHAAASDYTTMASAVVISSGTMGALAGLSAGAWGYSTHFMIATGLGVLATFVATASHRILSGEPQKTGTVPPRTAPVHEATK